MKSYMIDTHSHIEMIEDISLKTVISNALESNVKKIIIPGVEPCDFEKIINIAKENENVYCMLGIHPSEASKWTDDLFEIISKLVKKHEKIVAIGEIGLDYYWDTSFNELQKEVYAKQIILANELNLPMSIHDREAHKDSLDIFKQYNKNSEGIMHCFSGSKEFLKECLDAGLNIALGGVVTFKNAKKVKEVAKEVPLENLLLETDAPYLTPVPFRGDFNQPAYVKYVAQEIANIKNIPVEEVIDKTTQNAERIFKI